MLTIQITKIFINASKTTASSIRLLSSAAKPEAKNSLIIRNTKYVQDDYTNVTPKIILQLEEQLHVKPRHPLSLVRQKIVNYFYKAFANTRGNPLFSVFDNLSPIVTVEQNFDSLLVAEDHPSRKKSDCYYINREYLLRAHTTCHQSELIRSGLDNFLIVGDVYRRDEIDRTHYPAFHQIDAVRLRTKDDLFQAHDLELFEQGNNTKGFDGTEKQVCHTLEAVTLMEHELKSTLVGLAKELFGKNVEYRWVDTFFPFTLPSWELEVFHDGEWMELLGCGIMRQPILTNSGVNNKIGWAFGLGLERIAMCLYKIPDIRLFWSKDTGFLNQFNTDDPNKKITYKPISQFPQCINDISFWLPEKDYNSNDFYDLVRTVGGDLVEQVKLVDDFMHPKTKKTSHCYRIIYRHMERTLTQDEVNVIHKVIELAAVKNLSVTIR